MRRRYCTRAPTQTSTRIRWTSFCVERRVPVVAAESSVLSAVRGPFAAVWPFLGGMAHFVFGAPFSVRSERERSVWRSRSNGTCVDSCSGTAVNGVLRWQQGAADSKW